MKTARIRDLSYLLLIAVVCLGLAGCSDDDKGASPDAAVLFDVNPPDEGSVDLPTADTQALPDASATTRVSGRMTNRYSFPIPDVKICLYKDGEKTTECTQTDATGVWSIEVPMNAEVGLVLENAGTEDSFLPLYLTEPLPFQTNWAWSDTQATSEYEKVGVSYPPTDKGHILVNGGGVSIAVVPQAGVGPYYGVSGFDTSLTQAPDDGGWGEIMDLPPGTYDVDVTHASKSCANTFGWPPNSGHTLRVPVLAGYGTVCFVDCQ